MLTIITIIDIVARITFLTVTTLIFVLALVSYSRVRSKKMQLLTLGFGLFFVHGVISIPELFFNGYNIAFTDSLHLLIDAVALIFIFLGVLRE